MGGYQILDFVGIDLKDGGNNLLIYNLLNNTTRKVILGTSLIYDSVELKDEYFTCEVDGTSYVLKNASFSITIASDGTITCEKATSGGSTIITFETLVELETYMNDKVDDYYNIVVSDVNGSYPAQVAYLNANGGSVTYGGGNNIDDIIGNIGDVIYIALSEDLHLISMIVGVEK